MFHNGASRNLPLSAAALLSVFATSAHALVNKAFVSGHGTNAATCGTPTAPCRTFQYVHNSIIAAGGVIAVLDSGEFGSVTITKSLSIINDGAGTALVKPASGQNAITISAAAGDKVLLRGLTVDGAGGGSIGLRFNSGFRLTVANCVFRRFTGDGILIASTTAMGYSISNTISDDNGGAGIAIAPSGGAWGTIDRVETAGNSHGILVTGLGQMQAIATISNSVASNNRGDGIAVRGAVAHVHVNDTVSANNANIGFRSFDFGRLTLVRATATANNEGISADGPTFVSDTKVSYSTWCGIRSIAPAQLYLTRSAGISNYPDVCGDGQVYSYGDNRFGYITVNLLPLLPK